MAVGPRWDHTEPLSENNVTPLVDVIVKNAVKAKAKSAFHPFKKDAGHDIDAEAFSADTTGSIIQGSRLLWLKQVETASVTA